MCAIVFTLFFTSYLLIILQLQHNKNAIKVQNVLISHRISNATRLCL